MSAGIIERVPATPTEERVFYLPYKPIVKQDARTTKTRMVFDASAKPRNPFPADNFSKNNTKVVDKNKECILLTHNLY